MAIPGWILLRRKLQWSTRSVLHGYSAATPQLLRKFSAAGRDPTAARSVFNVGKHVCIGDADFQAACPFNRRKCNLPSERPDHRRGVDTVGRVCDQAATAEIALASFDGARRLKLRNGATKDFPNIT